MWYEFYDHIGNLIIKNYEPFQKLFNMRQSNNLFFGFTSFVSLDQTVWISNGHNKNIKHS